MSVYIAGTGSYLPERILNNADLEKMVETSDEWIRVRTGIEERHLAAANECPSDMAKVAAERAMQAAGITGADLSAIIVATSTADYTFPTPRVFCSTVSAAGIFCVSTSARLVRG